MCTMYMCMFVCVCVNNVHVYVCVCLCMYGLVYPTIMQGFSVCLFANSSFSSHVIDIKPFNPPQWHPWSVLRGLVFCFRPFFQNLNETVLSAVLERHHFYDMFKGEYTREAVNSASL